MFNRSYGTRSGSWVFPLIYIIFGLYFIDYALNFLPIPASFEPINKWIFLVGGVLIIIGAINHYRVGRYRNPF